MKSLLLVLFCTIVLSACWGCGGPVAFVKPWVNPDFVKTYKVFGPSTNKRIFLTHGVWSDDTQYDSGELNALRNGLVAKGFQVITFSYPYTEEGIFLDKAKQYRDQYHDFLQWLIDDTNLKQGPVTELDIGGFSFGGLHALIGSAMFPFQKTIALLPVSDPERTSLFHGRASDYFNAFNEIEVLSGKAEIITTSQDDNILGYENAQELSNEIMSTYYQYTDCHGHDVSASMVTDVLNWI